MNKIADNWTDEGKSFIRELQKLSELEVRVGYSRDQGTGTCNTSNTARSDIVDIALWNEMGTSNVPSRPFMRNSVDKHKDSIDQMLHIQREAFLKGTTAEQLLKTIGLFQQDLIQTEIEQGSFVENAATTIKKKRSERPLIDTGTMKNSVHYSIVQKGSMD